MNEKYEKKRENIWKLFDKDDKGLHINYFCPSDKSCKVTGKVFEKYPVKYYKHETKAVRKLLRNFYNRKGNKELTSEIALVISGLEHYLSQAEKEKAPYIMLGSDEYYLIKPKKDVKKRYNYFCY